MAAKKRLVFRAVVVFTAVLLLLLVWYWSGKQFFPGPEEGEKVAIVCEDIYTDLKAAQQDFLKAGKQVCGLDLSGRKMPSLTRGVSFVTSLTWLDLSDNNFTELPQEMVALQELKMLDLRGNPLPQEEVDKIRKLLPKADVKF